MREIASRAGADVGTPRITAPPSPERNVGCGREGHEDLRRQREKRDIGVAAEVADGVHHRAGRADDVHDAASKNVALNNGGP